MIASYDDISNMIDRLGVSLNSLAELAGVSTALLNRIANGSRARAAHASTTAGRALASARASAGGRGASLINIAEPSRSEGSAS